MDSATTGENERDESGRPLSPDQLAEAKSYGRLSLVCMLVDRALDVAYLAAMALFVAVPLDRYLAASIENRTLRLAAMFLIVIGGHMLVSFPLSVYSGHILERRFGLSRQSFGGWLVRYAKRNGLAVGFGLVLFVGLYWTIWQCGAWWWVVAAAGFFVVSVLFGQLMPVLVLPMFYKIARFDEPELTDRMERLARGTGLTVEGVYRMELSAETAKANAMLAGLGRTRRVLIGDTLLEQFTPDEIEVIFAHELGHHVYRHLWQLIAAGVIYSAGGFWLCDKLLLAWARHIDVTTDHAGLPVYTLPLAMLVLTLSSLVLEPLQNAISRHYERQCDRYALVRTGFVEAYRSAFNKLARINKDDPDPHPVEVFLFHSHPPISQRLAAAEEPA